MLLPFVPDHAIETCIVAERTDAVPLQQFGNLLCLSAAANVYDGTAARLLQDVNKLLLFVECMTYDVGQVLPLVAHAEDVEWLSGIVS